MSGRRRFLTVRSYGTLLGVVVALIGALILSATSAAASNNKGDFWLNNVGTTTAGQSHVPHLSGDVDIAMFASYPGAASGQYAIMAWPPTGHQQTVMTGSWTYTAEGVPVATISVSTLIANTKALNITPQAQQGYHFKMLCTSTSNKSLKKMKEFWVSAPTTVTPPVNPPNNGGGTNTVKPSGGVAGETGSKTPLAETGGPVLGAGLLLMLLGGFTWLGSTAARKRS